MRSKRPSQSGAAHNERPRNKWIYTLPYLGSAALVLGLAAFMGLRVKEKTLMRLAAEERTIRIWDARTGQPITEPLNSTDAVTSVQFSPDGTQLTNRSHDGKSRVWDTRTGKLVTEVGTNGTVRIWDVRKGKELETLSTNRSVVTNAWFSPDGKQVITTSQDGKVRIWNVENGCQEVPSTDPGTGAKKP